MIGRSPFDVVLYWMMIFAVLFGIAAFIARTWGD